jgi:hypothetical protein
VAAFALPGKIVLHLRDFLWDGVVKQLFKMDTAGRKK